MAFKLENDTKKGGVKLFFIAAGEASAVPPHGVFLHHSQAKFTVSLK